MITAFLLGFIFSFLGYTLPSVLNMTALKISLHKGKKEFLQFSLGVSLIVFIQAYLSIYLTKYITNNSTLLEILEKAGIIVLLFLSIYFYKQHKKEKQQIKTNTSSKNNFLVGIVLSTLNMFAIPFFCGITALLISFNLMDFDTKSTFIFVVGVVFGTYAILYLYGNFAHFIQQKTGNLTTHINLLLTFITAGFGLFTLIKLVL